MAKPTAIITATAIWRSPTRCDYIESNGLARITNYAEFLALHPPEQYVEIFENTAWSCVHGVGRWRQKLRLQFRRAWRLEPGMAGAVARGAGLAARRSCARL